MPGPRRLQTVAANAAGDLLTVEQAADWINMSTRYVRRLVDQRRIPFYRVGRCIRLKTTDLDQHVEAGRVDPLTPTTVWRELRRVA